MNLTLQNVLYTLGLHLDLILIPRIYAQGLDIIFGINAVVIFFPDRNTVIKEIRMNRHYLVNVLKTPQVFLINSLKKPVPIDIQHCYFGHIGIDAIRNVVKKRLVDGLYIIGNYSLKSIVVATTRHSRTNDLTTSKALQWAIK